MSVSQIPIINAIAESELLATLHPEPRIHS
jgi:tRNA isopentenyl-2-thiomethyl-A-37 hydroxylase MiaE